MISMMHRISPSHVDLTYKQLQTMTKSTDEMNGVLRLAAETGHILPKKNRILPLNDMARILAEVTSLWDQNEAPVVVADTLRSIVESALAPVHPNPPLDKENILSAVCSPISDVSMSNTCNHLARLKLGKVVLHIIESRQSEIVTAVRCLLWDSHVTSALDHRHDISLLFKSLSTTMETAGKQLTAAT